MIPGNNPPKTDAAPLNVRMNGGAFWACPSYHGPASAEILRDAINKAGLLEASGPEIVAFLHQKYDNGSAQGNCNGEISLSSDPLFAYTAVWFRPSMNRALLAHAKDFHTKHPTRRSLVDSFREGKVVEFECVNLSDVIGGAKSPSDISLCPFFRGAFGKEGASKLASLADRHSARLAHLRLPDYLDEKRLHIVGLSSSARNGGRVSLNVCVDYTLDDVGYALAVFPHIKR